MDPNEIELKKLSKNFEYHKIASQIDGWDDTNELRNMAKSFCKLYFKQQETIAAI